MKFRIFLTVSCALIVAACGGSSSSDDNGANLGPQIDAEGRPAINTALMMTFSPDDIRNAALDDNNATGNSDRDRFTSVFADQLAVYDALAGGCGDNPLTNRASADPADGLATGPSRYDFIASVLVDDQLYVNSSTGGAEAGQCTQYLAAELGVIGVPGLSSDCGGRTLDYDVIQTTYSAVAIGAVTGVDDGLTTDNRTHSQTEFPFLAPAQG